MKKKKFYNTPISEQETNLTNSRGELFWWIYTSDRTIITKIDKIYTRTKEDIFNGKVRAVMYQIPFNAVSIRKPRTKKPRTISKEHLATLQNGRKKPRNKDR